MAPSPDMHHRVKCAGKSAGIRRWQRKGKTMSIHLLVICSDCHGPEHDLREAGGSMSDMMMTGNTKWKLWLIVHLRHVPLTDGQWALRFPYKTFVTRQKPDRQDRIGMPRVNREPFPWISHHLYLNTTSTACHILDQDVDYVQPSNQLSNVDGGRFVWDWLGPYCRLNVQMRRCRNKSLAAFSFLLQPLFDVMESVVGAMSPLD
ncbi:hypothetical protein BaRGS_00021201 [Batillaria attramentaria]|uniref:Uncharacterized protein n=1 Tax=Batillaria attramentaria TaxID=370345 RepID=A0ABD0KK19_9CAEN